MQSDVPDPLPYATPYAGNSKRLRWIIWILIVCVIITSALAAGLGWLWVSGNRIQITTTVTNPAPAPPVRGPTVMPSSNVELSVVQRRSTILTGSNNTVWVHIADITAGQTLVSIMDHNGKTLLPATSLSEGKFANFTVGKGNYQITAKQLHNKLVGSDFGVFVVGPATAPSK